MIKALGLALYGPLAASTRYRFGQYVPGLARLGVGLQVTHLLGDDYLRWRFGDDGFPLASMLGAGLGRVGKLLGKKHYDVAMVNCELFPLMPAAVERSLIRRPYIYDFDDAFYLKYRKGRLGITKPLLGGKFDALMAGAFAVTAGNRVLGQYAMQHNSQTHHLPTVVDAARYLPQCRRGSGAFTLGWIGSPTTNHHLTKLIEPLSLLGREGPVRFVVIGGKPPAIPNVEVVEVKWAEDTEIDLLNSFDVGLMPLHDNEWTRGKSAFKLIQYMACALPVIASPVGANVDVVTDECGMLAKTSEDWLNSFRLMRDQPRLRSEMGCAGRERVIQHYSLQAALPILAKTILRAAKGA